MHTGYELLWMAAERTPMHPALIDDRTDRRLTYAELIAEVDGLMRLLPGLRRGELAGACGARSLCRVCGNTVSRS